MTDYSPDYSDYSIVNSKEIGPPCKVVNLISWDLNDLFGPSTW